MMQQLTLHLPANFERQVSELEKLPIKITQTAGDCLKFYHYTRAATDDMRVGEFLRIRLSSYVGKGEVSVLKPDGKPAAKSMKLGTLRLLWRDAGVQRLVA